MLALLNNLAYLTPISSKPAANLGVTTMREILTTPTRLPPPFFDLDPSQWAILQNHIPAPITLAMPLPLWVH